MIPWQAYLDDLVFTFRKLKTQAEKAIQQTERDEFFFQQPAESSNSIAIIVKHVAGNLKSRWTDFLTTDGDKPWRDRDNEFQITETDSREALLAEWDAGWNALFDSVAHLTEADLTRTITIRGEAHSVFQAIHRSLSHTSYHIGQIVYLCRMLNKDGWQWITIPPGQSEAHKKSGKRYLSQ